MAFTTLNQNFLVQGSILDDDTGSEYDISSSIVDVMVKKDYSNNWLPLYVIDTKTTEEYRNIMRDHNIRINLKIFTYDITAESASENEDIENPVITDTVFSGIIRIYEKPYTTTAAKTEEEDSENNTQINSAPFVYYRLTGVPEDLIEKNKIIVNQIYRNATLNDILVNILSGNDSNDIFIQPTDNTQSYKSVLIPPRSLIQAIDYLDENYQLYNGLCYKFFDSDKTFVYNPYASEFDYENVFECKIKSINSTGSNDTIRPSFDSETKNVNLVLTNLPAFSHSKEIVGNSIGSNTTYYSYDDNFNLVLRSQSNDIGFEKTKYFWNNSTRKIDELSISTLANKTVASMNIPLVNVDPNYFRPTTRYIIDTDYEEAAGDYYISQLTYSFSSNDFTHYKSVLNLYLIKK